MFVRRAPSAVRRPPSMGFCPEHILGTVWPTLMTTLSGAFLGNLMPHLDDIWYAGRARAEGAHGDLDGGQRSSEVKWGKLCAMVTIFGQKKPWCKLRMMMMTLMEVKGHQRSNGVNYVLWLPYLVKRSADASREWWFSLGRICGEIFYRMQRKHGC